MGPRTENAILNSQKWAKYEETDEDKRVYTKKERLDLAVVPDGDSDNEKSSSEDSNSSRSKKSVPELEVQEAVVISKEHQN